MTYIVASQMRGSTFGRKRLTYKGFTAFISSRWEKC